METIHEEIEAIKEKLKTSMTPGQKRDWQMLLEIRIAKLKKLVQNRPDTSKRNR